jgi:hypothetical protein
MWMTFSARTVVNRMARPHGEAVALSLSCILHPGHSVLATFEHPPMAVETTESNHRMWSYLQDSAQKPATSSALPHQP